MGQLCYRTFVKALKRRADFAAAVLPAQAVYMRQSRCKCVVFQFPTRWHQNPIVWGLCGPHRAACAIKVLVGLVYLDYWLGAPLDIYVLAYAVVAASHGDCRTYQEQEQELARAISEWYSTLVKNDPF